MIQNGRFAAAALALAALTCSVATAGDDVVVTDWIPLGSGLLGPGESLDFDVDIVLEGDEQGVIGFEVRFGRYNQCRTCAMDSLLHLLQGLHLLRESTCSLLIWS